MDKIRRLSYVQKLRPPSRGSMITVEPIRAPKDLEAVKRLLKNRPRDLMLLVMGTNKGLLTGDRLTRKAG